MMQRCLALMPLRSGGGGTCSSVVQRCFLNTGSGAPSPLLGKVQTAPRLTKLNKSHHSHSNSAQPQSTGVGNSSVLQSLTLLPAVSLQHCSHGVSASTVLQARRLLGRASTFESQQYQQRCYATQSDGGAQNESAGEQSGGGGGGFGGDNMRPPPAGDNILSRMIASVQQEMQKSQELSENMKRLDAEMSRLNETEKIQDAKKKFEVIDQERMRTMERLWRAQEELVKTMLAKVEDVRQTEYGKRMAELSGEALRRTREAAEALEKSAEQLGNAPGVKQVAESMKVVISEIDSATFDDARIYRSPKQLKMRTEELSETTVFTAATMEANTDVTGIQLHKSSRWAKSFKEWTDDNPYYNKILDYKIRYDESDNPLIRMTRAVTDRVTDAYSRLSQTQVSEVLTEIAKVDPSFDKFEFLRFCEQTVIPNVLEAMSRGDLDVLNDWCYEIAFKQLEPTIKDVNKMGYKLDSKVLDLSRVEIVGGKVMEQGPVLIINFSAQQTQTIRNLSGKVIQGDPETALRVQHVWALCRDMEEFNPKTAWKVLEIHFNAAGTVYF